MKAQQHRLPAQTQNHHEQEDDDEDFGDTDECIIQAN